MRNDLLAHRLFFPLAAGLAAVSVPLWVAVFEGQAVLPSLSGVAWHGHEMLFGVAGAAIAGFLITRTSRARLAALVVTWLAARAGAYAGGLWAWLALPFPLLLAAEVIPSILRSAKQWSNLPLALVPAGLVLAETVHALGAAGHDALSSPALAVAADLVLLLLVLMGGRLTRTATAGLVQRPGVRLPPVGRTRERVSVLALLLHAALGLTGLQAPLGGACLVLAGVLTLQRLARWWTPLLRYAPEIAGLHLGCLWLGVGLVLTGLGEAGLSPHPSTGLHAAFVGGFGTLALTVSARTTARRAGLPFVAARGICRLAPLPSLAAASRLAADLLPAGGRSVAFWIAAGLWSSAFALLALWLVALSVTQAARTPARSSARSR